MNCIGENEAGIDTLQMLTNIENRLEELFEKMQKMPADRLVDAEKVSRGTRSPPPPPGLGGGGQGNRIVYRCLHKHSWAHSQTLFHKPSAPLLTN